jgi:hypothetical protein
MDEFQVVVSLYWSVVLDGGELDDDEMLEAWQDMADYYTPQEISEMFEQYGIDVNDVLAYL